MVEGRKIYNVGVSNTKNQAVIKQLIKCGDVSL